MKFITKNKETTSFKKRYNLSYKTPNLIFGEFSLTFLKSYNIEYLYLYSFRRKLKRFFNFKKTKKKKIWLFLHKNYPLTKKSKNSRMGKGKGKFVRYCARILKNHNLFEFSGFNLKNLLKIKIILKKKINIPSKIYSNFFLNKSYCFGNKNEKFFFCKLYKS